MKKIMVLLILVVFSLACVQENEIKEIAIPGHGQHIYQFTNDVREALQVKSNAGIREAVFLSDTINFIFNGSSREDNAYVQVVVFNIVSKLQTYFAYEGKLMKFNAFYYLDDKWYNGTDEIAKPDFELAVWFLGPAEASETSVILKDNIIYLQGTSYKSLTLAGDKFALIVMDIDLEDIS